MLIDGDLVGWVVVLAASATAIAAVGGLAGRLFVEITRGNRY